jgi:hypothetical protein
VVLSELHSVGAVYAAAVALANLQKDVGVARSGYGPTRPGFALEEFTAEAITELLGIVAPREGEHDYVLVIATQRVRARVK